MSNIDSLKEYFNSLPEVKRIHQLEPYIDNSEKIKKAFENVKEIQKLLVQSKEFNQNIQYEMYLKEYNEAKERLLDLPFVEEYLELIDIVGNMLKELSLDIEDELYKKINE